MEQFAFLNSIFPIGGNFPLIYGRVQKVLVSTQKNKVDGLVLSRHQQQMKGNSGQKVPGRKLAGPGGEGLHRICPAG